MVCTDNGNPVPAARQINLVLQREPGETKATYRMLGNENLDREAILRTHREQTARRMAQAAETILLIQDTTSLNYNTQLKTQGIGYISDKTLGVNIHTCLAVTTSGLVLGVLDQMSYNREEPQDERQTHESKKVRPLEEKESYRWVNTLDESTAGIPEGVRTVSVWTGKETCTSCLTRLIGQGSCFWYG